MKSIKYEWLTEVQALEQTKALRTMVAIGKEFYVFTFGKRAEVVKRMPEPYEENWRWRRYDESQNGPIATAREIEIALETIRIQQEYLAELAKKFIEALQNEQKNREELVSP